MAPPDFLEFSELNSIRHPLTVKKEIKPHPSTQLDDIASTAPTERGVEIDEGPLESPPSPLEATDIGAGAISDFYETPPRQWGGPIDGNCPNSIAPSFASNLPLPTGFTAPVARPISDSGACCQDTFSRSDLELSIALAFGLFILGAVTGSSLVYSFSKPVIVHAAS